jgi:hypothetical protein
LDSQPALALAMDVPIRPSTTYVNGEARYMKIQKPGSSSGVARILEEVSYRS